MWVLLRVLMLAALVLVAPACADPWPRTIASPAADRTGWSTPVLVRPQPQQITHQR